METLKNRFLPTSISYYDTYVLQILFFEADILLVDQFCPVGRRVYLVCVCGRVCLYVRVCVLCVCECNVCVRVR